MRTSWAVCGERVNLNKESISRNKTETEKQNMKEKT